MNHPSTTDTQPLFTVIIPTKNRAEYLYHTLRTCMMQDYEPLEVVVSDDASTDNTRQIVEEAARVDRRIRYMRTDTGIGMRDNFERALAQVRPGYVIALGGDDGLLPGGIRSMHDVLRETGMSLLTWPAPIYRYPADRRAGGQLAVSRRKGLRLIDAHRFLCRQARTLHYLSDVECPMFYVKGVASTSLIEQVRRRSPDGRFYAAPVPDGYSGIVLAGEVSRYAFSGRPFSIYGLSGGSQGQADLSNDERAKKLSEEFASTVASIPMHRELASQPYSPLITLMTVDYLLTASDLPGWAGAYPTIDYRQVLRNGIRELANGLYGDERIQRELRILYQIAEKHDLGAFFQQEVRRTPRHKERRLFEGTGLNASGILLDASAFGVHNIFDAAYAAQSVYQAYLEVTPGSLLRTVARSIRYRYRALGGRRPFPPASAWN
jgi:hypothetical protein